MNHNAEVLKTIGDFVINTEKVKQITEGIIDISSQTNLLFIELFLGIFSPNPY